MSEKNNNEDFVLEQYLTDDDVLTDFPDIREDYQKSGINEQVLRRIAKDYYDNFTSFETIAKTNLLLIQNFDNVHFVKYRIKSLYSLVTKIIQHASKSQESFTEVNYCKKITDLIGFRILYLFKSDYLPVHNQIMNVYEDRLTEDVKVKLKTGDDEAFYDGIEKKVTEYNKSYRSIHYTVRSEENNDNCPRMEIQTRTIYEEAWSEMNHRLVYKKHYPDKTQRQLQDLSNYLSSLTGVCDMLGHFMLLAATEKDGTDSQNIIIESDLKLKQPEEIAKVWKKFLDVI
jgi:putative GTP pyrophosphokinase